MMFRVVFWVIYHFTRQYNPEDNSEQEDFSSILCVQTGSEAHPASCTMGTGVLSPGVKSAAGA
jgi:hypothetical protein